MEVELVDAERLSSMPLFGAIESGALHLLLADAKVRRRRRGEFFFKEHDEGCSVFVMLEGSVLGIKESDQLSFVFRRYQSGDCFGEMAFIDLSPREVSCVAATDAVALEFEKLSLLALFRAKPDQYALIQMNLAREMSRRLRTMDNALFHHLSASLLSGYEMPPEVTPFGVV